MGEVTHEHGPTDQEAFGQIRSTSPWFWVALLALVGGSMMLFVNFARQIQVGHVISAQSSHGAIWGIIVVNIINFIGISHIGIAISAVVRILRLHRYRQLARLAEFITLAAITTAVTNIAMDVGRPERFILNVIWFGRHHSPFVWSATVISTYVTGSSVYLYLAMRSDVALCAEKVPHKAWFYKAVSLGYRDTPTAKRRHSRTVWWLAVIILPIMVSVHSVYGYIFGTQVSRPGWFNPFMAPYFVLGAILSGFSMVIPLVAVLRKAFGWEALFPARLIKGLGIFLGFICLLYMYFLFSEYLTGTYAPAEKERDFFNDVLYGSYAKFTWTTLFGMAIPFAYLFIQGTNPRICSITGTVIAAVSINISAWAIRAMIVIPTYYHAHLPWEMAPYVPTMVEWGQVAGSFCLFFFLLLILLKVFPTIEVRDTEENRRLPSLPMPVWKRICIGLTFCVGVGLIVTGLSNRLETEYLHAPATWIAGIVVLLTVPLQACILPEHPEPEVPGERVVDHDWDRPDPFWDARSRRSRRGGP
jgi:molybdopterin-containing oxidoreductase family membrane subunit